MKKGSLVKRAHSILSTLIAILLATGNFACSQSPQEKSGKNSDAAADVKQNEDDEKSGTNEKEDVKAAKSRKIGVIQDRAIQECSGIAISRNLKNHFWVHNDSGDKANVYLLDAKGATVSTIELEGVKSRDFEDIVSFAKDKRNYVAVGDVGDNPRRRKKLSIHIFEEPAKESIQAQMKIRPVSTIHFHYDDDVSRDCEALAYLSTTGQLLVCSKPRGREVIQGKTGTLFSIDFDLTKETQNCVARKISDISGGMITAMDCSPDGKRLVVRNYIYANVWEIETEDLKTQLTHPKARKMMMPIMIQSEAICFTVDGKSVVTASEGKKSPLMEVPVE